MSEKPGDYYRVIPRDLFNEAKLLKCLGQLSLIILDGVCKDGEPCPAGLKSKNSGKRFKIEMDVENGGICVSRGVKFTARGVVLKLHIPCYSHRSYPLICTNDEAVHVFDDEGCLSEEFVNFVNNLKG